MFAFKAEISAAHLNRKAATSAVHSTVLSNSALAFVRFTLMLGSCKETGTHIQTHTCDISIFPEFIVCFARMRTMPWKEDIKNGDDEDDDDDDDNIDDELVSTVWLTNVTNHHLICLTCVRPLHYDHKLIDFYVAKQAEQINWTPYYREI